MIFERLEKYYNRYNQYEESIKSGALLESPLMLDYEDTKTIIKEIDRLNNIIDELGRYLFSLLREYGGGGIIADIYNKLKELKEGKE